MPDRAHFPLDAASFSRMRPDTSLLHLWRMVETVVGHSAKTIDNAAPGDVVALRGNVDLHCADMTRVSAVICGDPVLAQDGMAGRCRRSLLPRRLKPGTSRPEPGKRVGRYLPRPSR